MLKMGNNERNTVFFQRDDLSWLQVKLHYGHGRYTLHVERDQSVLLISGSQIGSVHFAGDHLIENDSAKKLMVCISLKEQPLSWQIKDPITLQNTDFKLRGMGRIIFRVSEPDRLIQYLIDEEIVLAHQSVNDHLKWKIDHAMAVFFRAYPNDLDFFFQVRKMNVSAMHWLNRDLQSMGLQVVRVKIDALNMPQDVVERYQQYIQCPKCQQMIPPHTEACEKCLSTISSQQEI